MRNDKYKVAISGAITIFEFVSQGPKGQIKKRVQYQATKQKNLFNLAFGDINPETNEIDDKVISNNKDSLKVLSTVAYTIYSFIEKYPEAIIYAEGSNPVRTRLYRIGISNNLEELKEKFEIFGFLENVGWCDYEKNKDYTAFFITKVEE